MDTSSNSRRKFLQHTVSLLSQEVGFQVADTAALETLTEMLQAMLIEMGRSTRLFTEAAGRVEPTVGDFNLAMVDLGIRLNPVHLRTFARRHGRPMVPNPQPLPAPKVPQILSAGKRRGLPSYIPDHFPPMPDPHTYIRTPTHAQPLTDYSACREKTSQQKRDLERSLTKFYARTSPCFHLFPDNQSLFPLLAPRKITYIDPLVPRDQIFEEDMDVGPLNFVKKAVAVAEPRVNDDDDEVEGRDSSTTTKVSWELIDNPFLRAVKQYKRPVKLKP